MFRGAAVVMGVSSCGKTSTGEALARALQVDFVEGDALHPRANVAKMSAGTPLTDGDRLPWLERVGDSLRGGTGRIASCSALKRSYRKLIEARAGRTVFFVFLDGNRQLLEKRIAGRTNHFMPPALLASQLATLERPGPEERAKAFDIAMPVEDIVAQAGAWLMRQQDGT